ncbi:MAG TPA: hypothetical protein VI757_02015 [Bacteroidia bacterium]|nr:hypothetical protein [Bacteroidia bacterium]
MNYHSLFELSMILFALLVIGMGLTVIIRKKPLFVNYRWFLLLFILLFSQPFVTQLSRPFDSSNLLSLVLFLVFIGYMTYIMRGVMVIGADAEDFQNTFLRTLTEGNYQFEQSMTSIKIKEPELEMSVAFQSWVGSGQIRMKSKDNKETFNKIISQLRTKDIKTSLIMPIFYILIGGIILAMAFSFWRY